ncbi:hypothetical protein [Arthrobacter sp. NPDC092385]|uniref:hypothetical protein n=1 Tax=Arthrobacter sp. NPDC092385 TaxID=3363943 RepID=UPI00381032AA
MAESRKKSMHPARRRLIIAIVVWALVVRTLILVIAEALGISRTCSELLSIALFLAVFIPLSVAAARELTDLRRQGLEPLPQIPTRRSLIGFGVSTVLFWGFFGWLVIWSDRFVFPLLPILSTIFLIVAIRRYHLAGQAPTTDPMLRAQGATSPNDR